MKMLMFKGKVVLSNMEPRKFIVYSRSKDPIKAKRISWDPDFRIKFCFGKFAKF